MRFKTAVIGAGAIAQAHLKAVEQIKKLQAVSIADIDEQRAAVTAKAFHMKAYTDYREMLSREQPDITVITLPHFLHREAAVYCAEQGSHILLEKPMALTVKECEEMIHAAERNGIQLMVGHTQHYIAENIKAKELIMNNELGQLVMVNETRHVDYFLPERPRWFLNKAEAGGEIIMNLGAHSIDKIQWLLDTHFRKVKANLSFYSLAKSGKPCDIEGSGCIFLETVDHIPVTIAQSGYKGVSKHMTEFIFTNGMIKLETGKGLYISQNGVYEEVKVEKKTSAFERQFNDLINAIEGRKALTCTGTYAQGIIRVIDCIYRSHNEGREIWIE